jgi:hypothetical protein
MEVMELANLVRKRKLPCVCVGGCLSVSLSLSLQLFFYG